MSSGEDEQIDIVEVEVLDAGSEAIAEPLFAHGLTSGLGWDDLMSASRVSYGWNQGVVQAISTNPHASQLYRERFPQEEVRLSRL